MRDRTRDLWLKGKKDYRWFMDDRNRHNLLHELLISVETDLTIKAEFFGQKSSLKYIGNSQWINKETSYVLDWDGTHVCDRCGERLKPSFAANSIGAALLLSEMPHLAESGLCHHCEQSLKDEMQEDIDRGLIQLESRRTFKRKQPEKGWEFAWLDSVQVRE